MIDLEDFEVITDHDDCFVFAEFWTYLNSLERTGQDSCTLCTVGTCLQQIYWYYNITATVCTVECVMPEIVTN